MQLHRCSGRVLLLLVAWTNCALATAPILYHQPAYESPVRGDPDDLLVIAGQGLAASDVVVYSAISDTTHPPAVPPAQIPSSSAATEGVANLVNSAGAPYSIVVHLPAAMTAGQSYALWVVDPDGHWSSPLMINDARPLWITPDSAYQNAQLANLPRTLKVVGRNLQPAPGTPAGTQIRLVGKTTGTTYTLAAKNTNNDSVNTTAALERYVAAANLPPNLVPDRYTVLVSRDGTSWMPLMGNGQSPAQTFTVNADPVAPPTFSIFDPRFADPATGTCQPDDGIDDTGCLLLAIRAAAAAGGGTVVLGPGVWTMSKPGSWASGAPYSDRIGNLAGHCTAPTETCGVSFYGVLVPVGVSLQGAGAMGSNPTVIERGATWLTSSGAPLVGFTLQGNNIVSGISFVDDVNYSSRLVGQPELKLGLTWYFAHLYNPADPVHVSNIVISDNLFVRPYEAIGTGSLPTDHVYVTSNTFGGAYDTAIFLGQDGNDVHNLLPSPTPVYPYQPYQFTDSVIAYNTFYPSSNQQTATTYTGGGSIATQINTSLRLDFSHNSADGSGRQYLYNPTTDTPGWRAAHFWSTGVNQEMLLVSNNVILCPGDKYGDGEAIAFDGSGDLGGMPWAQSVVAAVSWTDAGGAPGTAVTAQGTLATVLQASAPTVDISSNPSAYYRGYWLQIVRGTGKGQWRKVESVALGSNAAGTVTLYVTPAFDVPPDTTSEILLAHAYWQNATVNNFVDQRTPTCTKANSRNSGGIISWYASTADSVMEGNQQYDTSGILLNHAFKPPQSSSGVAVVALQSANDVRGNTVGGEYNANNTTGAVGGIQLGYAATAYYCSGTGCPAAPPPDIGFGISVAHNTIVQADSTDSDGGVHPPVGAIGLRAVWNTGPFDPVGWDAWELSDATLIFQNALQGISAASIGTSSTVPRVGIGLDVAQGTTPHPPTSWRSTLFGNTCTTVDVPVTDFGLGSVRYCPAGGNKTCECAGVSNVDVGITAISSNLAPAAGSNVTYTLTIINHDANTTASAISLFVEPSAGVVWNGASFTSSVGSCDASIGVCNLGNLAPNKTIVVSVTASLPQSGSWPITFSVTHQDADSVPENDSVQITELVR